MMGFLDDVAKLAGALGAIIATSALLMHRKSPFGRTVRWFTRRNISEPLGGWAREQITSAMKPDVAQLDGRITNNLTMLTQQITNLDLQIVDVASSVTVVAANVSDLSRHNDLQHSDTSDRISAIQTAIARDPDKRTRSSDRVQE